MDPEWGHIAPLRIFSFDIECLAKSGGFPSALRYIIFFYLERKKQAKNESLIEFVIISKGSYHSDLHSTQDPR